MSVVCCSMGSAMVRLPGNEEEEEACCQRKAEGERDPRLLHIAPGQQLQRQDAQPAGEVGGEQDDEHGLGELDQRIVASS